MDLESFDQIPVNPNVVGDAAKWLRPNEKVSCDIFNGQMISFEVPFTVELEVVDAPPVVKGATATNQMKDAIVETGAKVRVPPFVEIGNRICIDTRTGEYLERAK
jgi:elongation factor P